MINSEKMVYFNDWCDKCVYSKLDEFKDPCFECLSNPVNEYSHKPVKFKATEVVTAQNSREKHGVL